MKKRNLALCLSILCGCVAGGCGDGDGGSEGSECRSVLSCPNTRDWMCEDISGNGNNVCLRVDMCSNGKLDDAYGESDVDCGGLVCGATCKQGKTCKQPTDCLDGLDCVNGTCAPTVCTRNEECSSGLCDIQSGSCALPETGADNLKYLVVNEMLGDLDTKKIMTFNGVAPCEFVEVVNTSEKPISLGGLNLVMLRTDNEKGDTTTIPLKGTIPGKGVLVAHNCPELPLPTDAVSIAFPKSSNQITNSATYDIYLSDGTTEGARASFDSPKKYSFNRAIDGDASAAFIPHTELNEPVIASPGYCANGGMFSLGCPDPCTNNTKDTGETDVDCGGACSAKCANMKSCAVDTDCASNYCSEGVCKEFTCATDDDCKNAKKGDICETNNVCVYAPTCEDHVKNQDETDVDCGGVCASQGKLCKTGQKCISADDCETSECTSGVCTGEKPAVADPAGLIINEIMDVGSKSPAFDLNENHEACEFIEIANPGSNTVSLDGIKLELRKLKDDFSIDTNTKPIEIQLKGILKGKNLLVVNNCATVKETPLPLPDDAISFEYTKDKLFTGTWTYDIALVSEEKESVQIHALKIASVVDSSYNRSVDFDDSSAMDKTTSLKANDPKEFVSFASPGYCANGGLYSENCVVVDTCTNNTKDGDESDVDCGGKKCDKCTNGKACNDDSDCMTNQCNSSGYCDGEIIPKATPEDLIVNEFMPTASNAASAKDFVTYNGNYKQCKFIEIVNNSVSQKNVDLSGCSVDVSKKNNDTYASVSVSELTGVLGHRNAIIVSNCGDDISLPTGTLRASLTNPSKINQAGEYSISITCGDSSGEELFVTTSKNEQGISMSRSAELTSSAELKRHTDITDVATDKDENPIVASPGYCANGRLLSNNCTGELIPGLQ